MTGRMFGRKSDEAVRREARRWSVRMHGDHAGAYQEEFDRWRAADPRHQAAYARLERQWSHAGLLAQTRIGQARALPAARPNWAGAPLGLAVAAMALIVLAVGLGSWTYAPGLFGGSSVANSEIASRVGEIRTLKLPDGSRVTLDTDSRVRLAFSPAVRKIALVRGRARFEVAHDRDRPFVVYAGAGTVTARGTIFDVSLLGGRVGVTLLRGVVDVREAGNAARGHQRPAVRLSPGQYTDFSPSEPPAPPQVAPRAENSWVSGMLSFDADRLGDALAQANRYSSAKISVADPALNDLRITGAYHVRKAAAFAHALAVSLDLKVANHSDGNIVLSRPS